MNHFPNWMADGLCTSMPIDDVDRLFFDALGTPHEALDTCSLCPVRQQCHDYADTNLIPHGVWGGESAGSRRARLGIDTGRDMSLGWRPEIITLDVDDDDYADIYVDIFDAQVA